MNKILQAIFCEYKNGKDYKEFSTKKTAAVILTTLAVIDLACLFFGWGAHWTERLTAAGVSEAVMVPIVTGEFALPGWAFKIYKDGKAENAA